ncbi:MAG: hypothetical protein LC624_10470 [Halobacteriales archaeon]|nr:hypothetical protein [Halobacteriales archaeon]
MRGNPFGWDSEASRKPGGDAGPAPRWLTYRCAGCGKRSYSGYTATALERVLAASPIRPDLFCAECSTDTPLDRAELRFGDDDAPYALPAKST